MNKKVKNITKSIALVCLIVNSSIQAQDSNSIANAIGSGLKKVATATKNVTFWSINHAIAVTPDWYEAITELNKIENPDVKAISRGLVDAVSNMRDPRAIFAANAILLFLNPIITHVGLQTIKYTLVNNIIDILIKDEGKQNRVKKAFATLVQFCGTRIAISLFLRPILLDICASELANILNQNKS